MKKCRTITDNAKTQDGFHEYRPRKVIYEKGNETSENGNEFYFLNEDEILENIPENLSFTQI